MTTRRAKRTARTATGLMLAPAVIAMRMPLLAAENGNGRETTRAVSEKMQAMAGGMLAAQASMMGSMLSFWPQALAGKVPDILSGAAQARAMDAASVPFGKAVSANHRRLSRLRKA